MYDAATCVGWSADSRWVVVGSKDLTARVFSANHVEGYAPPTLAGHREPLVHVAFAGDAGDAVFTVSKDGAVFEWRLEEEEEEEEEETDQHSRRRADRRWKTPTKTKTKRWRMRGKHFFHQPAKLTCASYHRRTGMLCAGFGHGVFTMHKLSPDRFEHVQTLSVSQEKVSACSFDETGDWIALGCARLGQLVVWEWQSEAYVYKQQGHYFDVNACAYAPDGSMLATAADDHKVKVWSASTGSCFVTFAEHKAPVSAVAFLPSGHALLSASLDGTVRAFDLMRYRNFRVMTSPDPCQFVSLAVDPTGEIVCAGA
jgi:periodic tryptophan protein 2